MAQTINDVILQEWRKLVQEEIERLADIVLSGAAVPNIESFRSMTGQIYAYRKAFDLLELAAENVEKRT